MLVPSAAATTLSPAQLTGFLARVGYPREAHADDALARLSALTARHICSVPFDTLALHYSPHRTLPLDLDALYDKVVVARRGGYCMELNRLFGAALRALGYAPMAVAGRVADPGGGWQGWTHMVNVVTIDGVRYMVDVAYGNMEPLAPVPLMDGHTFTQLAPRRGRVQHRALAGHSAAQQRLWVYETQEDEGAAWVERYCIAADVEWFPHDFGVANFYTSQHPASFMAKHVLAVRGEPDGAGGVGALVTLFGDGLRRQERGAAPRLVQRLASEAERVAAVERCFGVVLTPVERRAIVGLPSELRAPTTGL